MKGKQALRAPKNNAMDLCSKCNTPIACGAQRQQCWCTEYPRFLSLVDKTVRSCLCPECLAKRIHSELNTLYQEHSLQALLQLAKPYANKKTLIEHIDYRIENGMTVFLAWYHLKRGTCCSNGCRHCPYTQKELKRRITPLF